MPLSSSSMATRGACLASFLSSLIPFSTVSRGEGGEVEQETEWNRGKGEGGREGESEGGRKGGNDGGRKGIKQGEREKMREEWKEGGRRGGNERKGGRSNKMESGCTYRHCICGCSCSRFFHDWPVLRESRWNRGREVGASSGSRPTPSSLTNQHVSNVAIWRVALWCLPLAHLVRVQEFVVHYP